MFANAIKKHNYRDIQLLLLHKSSHFSFIGRNSEIHLRASYAYDLEYLKASKEKRIAENLPYLQQL